MGIIMDEANYQMLTNVTRNEIFNKIVDEYGVCYTSDGKKLISTPANLMGEYTIKPGTESICDSAFQYNINLIKVNIPSSVKYIGRCAFIHCKRLMTAKLPEQLEYMGNMAFTGCDFYVIIIPQSLKSIPESAFLGNRNLKTIIMHNDINSIGKRAFMRCTEIEEFVFPPKVKIVEEEVLSECEKLRKVVMHNGIIEIRNRAFAETPIEIIDIPDSVVILGDYIFGGCRNMKNIKTPVNASNISKHALDTEYVWD